MKANEPIKKIMHKSEIFILACVSVVCVFACGVQSVSAQASMSGGGYTLNGGVSVFDSSLSGGGYSLNPGGDSMSAAASGGGYVLSPTPFSPGSAGSDSGSSVSGNATGNTGGYTYYPNATGTYMQSRFLSDADSSQPGMLWIDQGKGVDTNLDGVADSYGPGSTGRDRYRGGKASEGAADAISPMIKVYENDLGTFKNVLLVLFIICAALCRIIRSKNAAYYISRIPLAILIDYIIALHKGGEHNQLGSVPIRDIKAEESLHALSLKKIQSKSSVLTLFDLFIIPILAVFCMVWIWPISPVLAMILGIVVVWRLFLGKKLTFL